MNLQPINPPLAGISVRCKVCGEWITKGGYADLDGAAFIDFHCVRCAQVIRALHNQPRVRESHE